MRKYLLAGITVLSVGSMMGCSVTNQADQNQDGATNSVVTPEETPAETPVAENTVSVTSYFGKVETVIGNEVSLKLAEQPNMEGVVPGQGSGDEIIGIGEVVGDVTQAIDSTISISGGVIEGDGGNGGEVIYEGEIMQSVPVGEGDMEDAFANIEYSGESKSIVVPAGVEIFNFKTGKDGKITDIKEGSILMMYAYANTNTVTRIEIMN